MGSVNTSPPSADMMNRSISAKIPDYQRCQRVESGRLSDESRAQTAV
jgi:hypothetical protein